MPQRETPFSAHTWQRRQEQCQSTSVESLLPESKGRCDCASKVLELYMCDLIKKSCLAILSKEREQASGPGLTTSVVWGSRLQITTDYFEHTSRAACFIPRLSGFSNTESVWKKTAAKIASCLKEEICFTEHQPFPKTWKINCPEQISTFDMVAIAAGENFQDT